MPYYLDFVVPNLKQFIIDSAQSGPLAASSSSYGSVRARPDPSKGTDYVVSAPTNNVPVNIFQYSVNGIRLEKITILQIENDKMISKVDLVDSMVTSYNVSNGTGVSTTVFTLNAKKATPFYFKQSP